MNLYLLTHSHGEREITKNMFYYKREVTFVSKWFAVNDLFLGLLKLSRSENRTCGSILERIV
jgi:hypothetical protein